MAITLAADLQIGDLTMGQNGRTEVWGQAAFTGTGASGTINLPVLRVVEEVSLTWITAPAGDEQMSWSFSAGVLTISRTGASKTADAQFSLRCRGY